MLINKQIKIKEEIFGSDRNFKDVIFDYLMYKLNLIDNDLHNSTSTCLRRSLLLTKRKEENV